MNVNEDRAIEIWLRAIAIMGLASLAALLGVYAHRYPEIWRWLAIGLSVGFTFAGVLAGVVRALAELDTLPGPEPGWQGWEFDGELPEILPKERLENQPENVRSRFIRGEVETPKGTFGQVDQEVVEAWKQAQEAKKKKKIEFEIEK